MLTALVGNLRNLSFLIDADDALDDENLEGNPLFDGDNDGTPVVAHDGPVIATRAVSLALGQRVGAYVIEAPLAEGGMAAIWLVRHAMLGSLHALKVPLSTEDAALRRAAREARLQAMLRHPNILAATDLVQVGAAPGIVLELVDGGETLESRIAAGPMSNAEIYEVFTQLCDAVSFAHAAGIVHRDLKPGNVLLSRVGERTVARIADFGLARALGDGAKRLTRAGTIMGSPLYMAPEQARDAASAGVAADVFSLGAILYEMVTGAPAFDAPDIDSILARTASGNYLAVERLVPSVESRWIGVIAGALRPDIGERTPDVASLRAAFTGQKLEAPKTGTWPGLDADPVAAPSPMVAPAAFAKPTAARVTPRRALTGATPVASDQPSPARNRPPKSRELRLPMRAVAAGGLLVTAAVGTLIWAAAQ